MSRTVNEQRPAELTEAILEYLIQHGLADLSLRPLAKAIGSSPRVLLYYFGSKEKMVVTLLAELRERQRASWGQLRADTYAEVCRAIWKQMSTAESIEHFRLYFEAYGLALRRPLLYKDFLSATIDDWIDMVAEHLLTEGMKRLQARAFATVMLAGFRGFMLDLCTTGDRKRVNAAVNMWLETLDSMATQESGGAR
jgi:AcrR family transcriptional regulator